METPVQMKAWYLIRNGNPHSAFELRNLVLPEPGPGEVQIQVEAFGINYADIMAVRGLYKDAPPLPCILGYDVVGVVVKGGSGVENISPGMRVASFSRFGGYATHINVPALATISVPDHISPAAATALVTQFCTAWYCAEELVTLHEGDRVLIHAAAGGVGLALIQLALRRKCIVFGTVGSEEKLQFIRSLGVHHPINYVKDDFTLVISQILGKKNRLDVVFDSIGGLTFKKGFRLLGAGGRMVGFGGSSRTGKWGILSDLLFVLQWGFHHPAFLLMKSKSVIGVNMLRVADYKPEILRSCLESVRELLEKGEINPPGGKIFESNQLADAIEYVGLRRSSGKVVVMW